MVLLIFFNFMATSSSYQQITTSAAWCVGQAGDAISSGGGTIIHDCTQTIDNDITTYMQVTNLNPAQYYNNWWIEYNLQAKRNIVCASTAELIMIL